MRRFRLVAVTMAAIFIGSLVAWSSAYSCGTPTKGDSGNKVMPAARKGAFKKISPHGPGECKNDSSRKTSKLDTDVTISAAAENDAGVKNATVIAKNDKVYGIVKYGRSGMSKDEKRDHHGRKSRVEFTGIKKEDIKSVSLDYAGDKLQFNVTKNDDSVVTFDVTRKNKHTPTDTDPEDNGDSPSTSVTMPTLPATITADSTRTAQITFSSGTLLPTAIKDLWAEVTYDGKTEYWDLDPSMLAADGKSMSIQFDSSFEGKTVAVKIYAIDKQDAETSFSNATNITIPTEQQPAVTMPTLPATITADSTRTAQITFSSGTLLPTAIKDLWAEVTYDGKTEYWDLDPSMLAADGKSMSIQFDSSFEGKTVAVKIYAIDKQDAETSFSNATNITIPTEQQPAVTMPTLPATITADSTRTAQITFSSGTLLPTAIKDLWAEVTYDGKTEYWDLDPSMLAADGKSMSIQFDSSFEGKTVAVKIYAIDKQDAETSFSNATNITIPTAVIPSVAMPTLPSSLTTDNTGLAKIIFTDGTLLPTAIKDLWAEVTYDGKTEYCDFNTEMLSADGRYMTVQFDTLFDGKTVIMKIYGFDTDDKQTSLSNPISILVNF